jgi:hypothetical protein
MGHPALLSIREEGVVGIPKISIALAGFKPATFGSSDEHTNHYTTMATCYDGSGPLRSQVFITQVIHE